MTEPAADPLHDELSAAGFFVLGRFRPQPADQLPDLTDGRPVKSVLMVANAGSDLWDRFSRSPEFADGLADPLDRYTKRCLLGIASNADLEPLFPFEGPPYHPFQKWALRAADLSQSPLGVLVSPIFGPWLGLRAALLSPQDLSDPPPLPGEGPCPACDEKPCIAACPVGAIDARRGYDATLCSNHLAQIGNSPCWSGCLSRSKCPHGQSFAPPPDQARFHMKAFLALMPSTAVKP